MQQKILATGNHPKIQKHPNLKFGLSWLILIPGKYMGHPGHLSAAFWWDLEAY